MKRFYKSVSVEQSGDGFQVMLDSRAIKTALGKPQLLPTRRLAEAMAKEWDEQGGTIDRGLFRYRDLADFSIDMIPADRGGTITKLLGFIETDTLCYRADPDEALFRRQQEVWDPLLAKIEASEGITLQRISGIIHKPQSQAAHDTLAARLSALDDFALASTLTMASLAASLSIALLANEDGADIQTLWNAANLEEDWQVEQWGQDAEAEAVRTRRTADFLNAFEFGRLALAQA